MIIGLPIDFKTDIWSFGCIIAEIILGFPLFACNSDDEVLSCIVGLIGDIDSPLIAISKKWKEFYSLTPRGFLLNKDPKVVISHFHYNGEEFLNNQNLFELIKLKLNNFSEKDSLLLIDLLIKMLEIDSSKRISSIDALNHPFCSNENIDIPFLTLKSSKRNGIANSYLTLNINK